MSRAVPVFQPVTVAQADGNSLFLRVMAARWQYLRRVLESFAFLYRTDIPGQELSTPVSVAGDKESQRGATESKSL